MGCQPHHCPTNSIKLYCWVIKAYMCEQLAKGCCLTAKWPGDKSATSESNALTITRPGYQCTMFHSISILFAFKFNILPLNHTHTDTQPFCLSGCCPRQPSWAGTRRKIHPLTPIVVINHHLSASSIYYDPWHPPCLIYTTHQHC